jgi:two-component SAPR family response regulator
LKAYSANNLGKKDKERLEIYTLGRFMLKKKDKLLSGAISRSYRLWELFKYLLTYRGKGVLPEIALEKLWPEQDYVDPKRTFRNSIYRLRHLLTKEFPLGSNAEYIIFSHGCYRWNPDLNYWLDSEEFESLVQKGRQMFSTAPLEAVEVYKKAIFLYRGEHSPEICYSEWVLPVRIYYRRLYLQSLSELLKILAKANSILKSSSSVKKPFSLNLWRKSCI